jgi:hypothetical protein
MVSGAPCDRRASNIRVLAQDFAGGKKNAKDWLAIGVEQRKSCPEEGE